MITAVQDKFNAGCDLAEFPDDQFIAGKIKMVFYVLLEIFDRIEIIVIGIIADGDIRRGDDILQKTKGCYALQWKLC